MITVFISFSFVCVIIWKFFIFKRPKKYPPGPLFRLPFYQQRGYLRNDRIAAQKRLRKQYGDLYSLELGTYGTIIVSELNIMRKLLSSEIFSHRIEISHKPHVLRLMTQLRGDHGVGIIASSGDNWKEQRRFALKNLRDFGLGKNSMEALILDEVSELSNKWKQDLENDGDDFMVNWATFNISILNALWGIVSSRRFDLNNPDEVKKFEVMNALFSSFGGFSLRMLITFTLPEVLRNFDKNFQQMFSRQHYLYNWFATEYDEHLKTYDESNLRDYIDCYIKERQRAEEEKDLASSFYGEKGHWNFVNAMLDLFVAGAETTSTTLQWAVAYLAHNPDVQERAQKELDEVVGRNRVPTLEDRDHLPYMESLIAEVQRCGNVAPFALFHCVEKDVEIDGVLYTKHSRIMPDLTAILSDPKNFEDPDQFIPERYLCKETGKFIPHPALVMFGVGKRECLGKSLAKLELYLFLAGLLHRFSFSPSKEGLPDLKNANVGITRVPKPFKVKIAERTF